MKVWISKYALSKGIYAKEVVDVGEGVVRTVGSYWSFFHGEGKHWHRTPEEALRRAEEMRAAKLASMRKQIAKLEKIDFAKGIK
jgi:hypothetical protein